MMKRISKNKKVLFYARELVARGFRVQLLLLVLATLLFILSFALIVFFLKLYPEDPNVLNVLWVTLMHAIDQGTITGGQGTWPYLLIMLFVTLGGILFTSVLISISTTAIQNQMEILRRGRTPIIENNHFLILGWSEQIFELIYEVERLNARLIHDQDRKQSLSIASSSLKEMHAVLSCRGDDDSAESQSRNVVILSEQDKVYMETQIFSRIPESERSHTRIFCRCGNPIELNDLKIVLPENAHAVIVVANRDDFLSDAAVLKIILALKNYFRYNQRKSNKPIQEPQIVAELYNSSNIDLIRRGGLSDDSDAGKAVEIVSVKDTISKILVQAALQPGLSGVYERVFSFRGEQFRVIRVTPDDVAILGKTLAAAAFLFEKAVLVGFFRHPEKLNDSLAAQVVWNADANQIIVENDQLIFLVDEEQSPTIMQEKPLFNPELILQQEPRPEESNHRIILLGWNKCSQIVLLEVLEYVRQRYRTKIQRLLSYAYMAEILLFNDHNIDVKKLQNDLKLSRFDGIKIVHRRGDITNKADLEKLYMEKLGKASVFSRRKTEDHVIIMSSDDTNSAQVADARTMMSLLHLRSLVGSQAEQQKHINIASEMFDTRNRSLISQEGLDDFIVTPMMTSQLLLHKAYHPLAARVLDELLSSSGSEIYLKPASQYLDFDVAGVCKATFATIIQAVSLRAGQLAVVIGYRKVARPGSGQADSNLLPGEKPAGIYLCPGKNEEIVLHRGADHKSTDQLILICTSIR